MVVDLIRIAPNRTTARQGSRIQQYGVTPAYNLAVKYGQRFSGEWQVQNPDGYATLTEPTPALKNSTRGTIRFRRRLCRNGQW